MPQKISETDRALKDKLNGNQAEQERMCLELLQTVPKFENVRPRLPKGGPDGGRDLQAEYEDGKRVFGAVGFVQDASTTKEHRTRVARKFVLDIDRAIEAGSTEDGGSPDVFVFFTNVALTPAIFSDLQKKAYERGIEVCEVFDQERIRILLDRDTGYAIRYRYLGIPLDDAEQKDFFSRWGERLQNMMIANLSEIGSTTKRLNFLAESQLTVDQVYTYVKLKRPIDENYFGQVAFHTSVLLKSHVDGLVSMVSGLQAVTHKADAPNFPKRQRKTLAIEAYSFAQLLPESPQHSRQSYIERTSAPDNRKMWFNAGSSSRAYTSSVKGLHMVYGSSPLVERFSPHCKLIDLNGALIIFSCSEDVSNNIEEIIMYANNYMILKVNESEFQTRECSPKELHVPSDLQERHAELKWRKLRPRDGYSAFVVDFIESTPTRTSEIR